MCASCALSSVWLAACAPEHPTILQHYCNRTTFDLWTHALTHPRARTLCPGTPMDSEAVSQQDYLQSVELMRDALSDV
eukprot:1158810-Pelagomonas_calceolata.AAC.7